MIFPFTSNPAAIDWKKDVSLSPDQKIVLKISDYLIKQNDFQDARYVYSHPYLCIAINLDPFDYQKCQRLSLESLKNIKKGDYVIWDNWLSVVEDRVTAEFIEGLPSLSKVSDYVDNTGNREVRLMLFKAN